MADTKLLSLSLLTPMLHSSVCNAGAFGLCCSDIGGECYGSVNLVEASRYGTTTHPTTSRADIQFVVLRGHVTCTIWRKQEPGAFIGVRPGDEYVLSEIRKDSKVTVLTARYDFGDKKVNAGESSLIMHDQIHSMAFSHDAQVLLFVGPEKTHLRYAIEPYVNGQHFETYSNFDTPF